MKLQKLLLMLTFFVLMGTTAFAQTTWYVNNQIGNDGRNGLSATIPSPDDGITGPKRTIGGAQGAVAESNAGDIISVANTGVQYAAGTTDAAFALTKKLTFRSTGGTVDVGVLVTVNNANAAPNNVEVFDSGAFKFSAGLTLTLGVVTNSSSLITVTGTITRSAAAAVVNGQLLYSGTVDFSYGATMTTGDEFVPSGGSFRHLTTTVGNLTIKSGTNFTMTGIVNTAGTLNLGGGVATISNSAGGGTHTIAGNVSNGTLAFSLGGAAASTQTINGAFTLPNVTVTTSNSNNQTLAIAQPTAITGTLAVSGRASVTTSAALVTVGTAGFTGDEVTLSGTGNITFSGATTTVHGNVLLSTAFSTVNLAQGIIAFTTATTVNGHVTNNASLTVTNANTWNGMTGARITFANAAHTISGNVVNSTTIGGATGGTLDVDGFGLITFANIANDVIINGAINNSSSTSLSSATNPADFSGNGLVTLAALTTADVRIDGGINNSSNYAGLTGAANVNNGRIVVGGAGRTAGSEIGAIAGAISRVGLITNSSVSPTYNDGNGDIVILGDNTQAGFWGTSVTVSGSALGGKTTFGNELFNISGNVTNSRTDANITLLVGTAARAAATVTIGGNIVNSGTGTTNFNVSSTGAVAVTGIVQSTANGTIAFPNIAAATVTLGGFTWSSGTFDVATQNQTLSINGAVDISGGTINWSAAAANVITITGNASFTGGSITSTNRGTLTLNSTNITLGGATTNPTFNTAATTISVGNPTPTSLATVNIGGFNPTIPGAFTVGTNNALAQPVNFTGGTMTVTGILTFATSGTASKVNISNQANITVIGNFVNTTGYTTTEQGRVTVGGGGGQVFGGAGDFGTIEFKNAAGPATSSAVKLTGTVYLTTGAVGNGGGAITFDNSTVTPTIVRNAGSFTAAPTFTSQVNVTYIGDDKGTGFELPAGLAVDKLNNLTVATTTGAGGANAVPSKGVVTVGTAATVNGTLLVNAGQTLLIDAVDLTIKGATITLNGDLANEGVGRLVLGRTAGTTISGSGYLPPVLVAAGSLGNIIDGPIALVHQLYGTDNEQGGAGGGLDFDPTTTSASGSLTFGAGNASLSLKLSGVAFDGSDLTNITTANAGNTLTLASAINMVGNLTHAAGTVDLGTFTLTHFGAAPSFTGGALTTNGTLQFGDGTTGPATLFSLNTSDVTIAANVNINLAAAATTFTLDPATAGNLIVSGNFTVTKGDVVLGNGVTARNLTVTGSNATLTANGTIDVTPTGIGTFRLNAATAPLTFTYAGNPIIARLRVSNDVNLAGTGASLTVSTAFTHDGGILNFGAKNLTFKDAFTRTAGTYAGTSGYMIFDADGATWTVDQGDGFTIPNLRFTQTTAHNIALSNAAGRGAITVSGKVDYILGAQTLTTNGKLAINDAVTVNYTSGALSASPTYANTIKLVALNVAGGGAIPTQVWPATAALVTTFTVNSAAAANTVALPGSRTVNTDVVLTRGTLALGGNTLTLVSGTSISRTDLASVTVGAGGFAFPADNNVNLSYLANTPAAITTGPEFPTVMNNLLVSRSANVGNATLTINAAATVNGTLTVYNDLTANGATNAQLTVKGATLIKTDATYSNATAPVVTFAQTAPLVFGGASGQTLDVTGGQNIAWLRLNMTGTNPTLDVTGNLTIPAAGALLFTNGILNMGTYTLTLPRPAAAVNFGGLAFDRSAVVAPNVGHVVGKVARPANSGDGGAGINGRFEFPVGTLTGQYRPAAITFTPSYVVGNPVTIIISHDPNSPTGTLGLPLEGGNGVKIGSYTPFYWLVSTTPSSLTSTQKFDLDLQANNIGVPYTSDQSLRIVRRQDGSSTSNGWSMQGTYENYANYQVVNGTDTVVVARTVSGQGGLIAQGSRFSIGVPSRAPSFTAPVANTFTVAEGATSANTVQFTAAALNIGETVALSKVSGPTWASLNVTTGLLTLTPGYTDASATAYSVVVKATSNTGLSTEYTLSVTVTNTNRAPSFAGTGTSVLVNGEIPYGVVKSFDYTATDADGESLTYTVALDQASAAVGADAPTITPAFGLVGKFTWKPAFADYNKTFVVTVTATDAAGAVATTSASIKVIGSYERGNANLTGGVDIDDAIAILKHVVGNPVLLAEALIPADANLDGTVNTVDAAWILKYIAGGVWVAPKVAATTGNVEFGRLAGENSVYNLPINVTATTGVTSVYAEVDINGSVEVNGLSARLPQGWLSSYSIENGKIKFAAAGTTSLTEGVVANIELKLNNKEAVVSVVGNAKLNEEVSSLLNAKVREIPSEFALSQNYPNPFNPTTSIKFSVAQDAKVNLVVYDMLGQRVRTLVDGIQEAGFYTVRWDGSNDFGSKVSSGIYIYRLQAGSFVSTMKMNLMK